MNRQNERIEPGDCLPWQAIVERSRIALVITDANVTNGGPFIVYANPAYAAATGRSAQDLIGRSPALLHGPATDSNERNRIRDALVRAVPVRASLVNYRLDGTAFDVDLDIAPILDGAGVCRNFVGVARDVTERRAELGRIKRSEEHLRLAADAGRVATWDWSVDDQELYWDKNMAVILGLPPDTTPSRELWLAALPPDDSTLVTPRFRDRGLSQRSWVQRLVRPDGEIRTVLNRATATERDERGEPLRVTGVLIDVTEEHRASDRVVQTLESLSDAYFSVDSNGRLTFVNRVAEALTGQSREQLLGKSLREMFLRFMEPTRRAQYDRCIATDEPVVFEFFADFLDQWIEIRVYPIPDGHAIYARDVTERHRHAAERESLLASETAARIRAEQAQAQLTFDAAHDHLTGLLNRFELTQRVQQRLEQGSTHDVVLFIDLDNFKLVNNNYGHSVGDRVLVEVARRLSNECRENDLIARSGGDEFIIAAHDIDDRDAAALAERVLRAIREPLRIDDRMIVLTASAGLASNRLATHASAETLLSAADLALYAAKDAGRARAAWFDKALLTRAAQRVRVDTELRRAIEQEELVLYFQPSFELPRLRLVGAEALVRWRHPTAGLLPPSEFINAAEEAGLITDLGDWVIRDALDHRGKWSHLPESFTIWVNVSVRQLQHPDFAQNVEHALRQRQVPPQQLGIEITEYALADEVPTVAEQLHALRAAGVRLAIDDFGTGYSSLSRLRDFPVDVIKIDQSFVRGIATDTSDKDIVATITRLARTFGSTTLAEGVETGEQLQALIDIGCDAASGYYLGRPTPSHDFIATHCATEHDEDRSTPRRSG